MDSHEDDIDYTGFELGMPTPMEMLEHQCTYLEAENSELYAELKAARERTAKVLVLNKELARQIPSLKAQLQRYEESCVNCYRELQVANGQVRHLAQKFYADLKNPTGLDSPIPTAPGLYGGGG